MKKPANLLPAVNLTPFTLTAYEGRAHWFRSCPLYVEAFRTLKEARETRALILENHPAAYIEITDEGGKVIEC